MTDDAHDERRRFWDDNLASMFKLMGSLLFATTLLSIGAFRASSEVGFLAFGVSGGLCCLCHITCFTIRIFQQVEQFRLQSEPAIDALAKVKPAKK